MRLITHILSGNMTDPDFDWSLMFLEHSNEIWRYKILVLILTVLLLGSLLAILVMRRNYRSLKINGLKNQIQYEEDVRNNVARELHDRLGSVLTVAKLHFDLFSKGQGSKKDFHTIQELLDKACDEARSMSHSFRSPRLSNEENFLLVLMDLFDQAEFKCKVHYNFHIQEIDFKKRIDKISLYRIFQELLTNSLKHSDARELWLRSTSNNETFFFFFEENGQGFDEGLVEKGLGISNIEARIIMLGGRISRSTNENGRFCTTIELPLEILK